MKNTTVGRKPGNTIKKNQGLDKPVARASQSGDGEDFAFNGQMGNGVNRDAATHRYSGNQTGLAMKENYGAGPRVASENSQASMHEHGKPVTRDKYRTAPDTAASGESLGKRAWEPSATQNYRGNPDKINVGMK